MDIIDRTIGMIVAFTHDMVIGLNGTIPWHYPADMKRFKRLTLSSTVIMGRKTWESLPCKPLPQRRNVVITRHELEGVETYASIGEVLSNHQGRPVWFIGGARIYEEALRHCGLIDATLVPDTVSDPNAVKFPEIDWSDWIAGPKVAFAEDPRLIHQRFTRK